MLPMAILAGGLATRLRPASEKIPKSLIQVAGSEFINHQLMLLSSKGIKEIVLCVGHLGEKIEEYVGDGKRWGIDISYSYDGEIALGTGGAVKKAIPKLGENFFILYGDSYLPIDYQEVAEAFLDSNESALITVFKNNGEWDKSNITFEPYNNSGRVGIVTRYCKKPDDDTTMFCYIDYGVSCFSAELFNDMDDVFDLAFLYERLAADHKMAGFEVGQRFYEIGSFYGIEILNEFLLKR